MPRTPLVFRYLILPCLYCLGVSADIPQLLQQALRIDLQNATNRKNPIRQLFDTNLLKTYYNYVLPIIPIFGIQVDFY